MDTATLDALVLAMADRVLGPGSQFSLTQAAQIHPWQTAQVLHYEQGIYPLPRDRDLMLTAISAPDDFTAATGATLVVPRSHHGHDRRPDMTDAIPAEMPADSVPLFVGRLWHAGGANVTDRPPVNDHQLWAKSGQPPHAAAPKARRPWRPTTGRAGQASRKARRR